jgi:hypothetical protein
MSLLVKSPGEASGVYPIAKRNADLRHLSFTIVQFGNDLSEHAFETGEEEVSIDSYAGPVRVEAEGSFGRWSAYIPARKSIAHPAPMVYLPAGARVILRAANGHARLTIGGALGSREARPAMLDPHRRLSARTTGRALSTHTSPIMSPRGG